MQTEFTLKHRAASPYISPNTQLDQVVFDITQLNAP